MKVLKKKINKKIFGPPAHPLPPPMAQLWGSRVMKRHNFTKLTEESLSRSRMHAMYFCNAINFHKWWTKKNSFQNPTGFSLGFRPTINFPRSICNRMMYYMVHPQPSILSNTPYSGYCRSGGDQSSPTSGWSSVNVNWQKTRNNATHTHLPTSQEFLCKSIY